MVNEIADNYESLIAAHLIGVDWGGTSLRVFLIGQDGKILATRSKKEGSSVLKGAREFSHALHNLVGDWIQFRGLSGKSLPIIACGMVGSQQGWKEAAYVECPTSAHLLANTLTLVDEGTMRICPGLRTDSKNAIPDVMRGEETQIFGALNLHPEYAESSCIVLPGTHSKWSQIEHEQVKSFATYMTGEMFAVLSQHSVLGRTMPAESEPYEFDRMAFLRGLDDIQQHIHAGLTNQLFAVRTLALTGQFVGNSIKDYLSGLLIGYEIISGLKWIDALSYSDRPIVLVGEPSLCQLYATAFDKVNKSISLVLDNTAPVGLWHIAKTAGLIGTAKNPPFFQG